MTLEEAIKEFIKQDKRDVMKIPAIFSGDIKKDISILSKKYNIKIRLEKIDNTFLEIIFEK